MKKTKKFKKSLIDQILNAKKSTKTVNDKNSSKTLNAKDSTVKKKPTIKTHQEEYHNGFFAYRQKPVHQDYLKLLAQEMLDYFWETEDTYKLTEFYNIKRIHHSTFEGWMERCPELKEAHDLVLQLLGTRREIGAIKGTLNEKTILRSMPMYDVKWRQIEEWYTSMKERLVAGDSGTKIVVLDNYGNSE